MAMAWRAAVLVPTCSAISFTRLAPEREVGAEAGSAVMGAPLQMVDFNGHDVAAADRDTVVDLDGAGMELNKNVIDDVVESERRQPLLNDYVAEANVTASEESAEAQIAAWEAQREASEDSEQANATAPEQQQLAARVKALQEDMANTDAEECEEVEPESACHDAVDWLRQFGFSRHPEWYPGYGTESTFEEVQGMLHGLGKAGCPKPCLGPALAKKTPACQDVVEGACRDAVTWLKDSGLERHPDWYPGLRADSSASEIQAELFRLGKANCPAPCDLVKKERAAAAAWRAEAKTPSVQSAGTEQCMDAEPDTTCYTAVTYAMNEGISKHPSMYEGLRTASSFKKVQEHLYLNNMSSCAMPCPDVDVDISAFSRPEDLRVQKRVEDMSVKELGDFFSGKWDGKVARIVHGDWQPTTTFQKRQYEPTTTLPIEQQPLPDVDDDSNDVAWMTSTTAAALEPTAAGEEITAASAAEPAVLEPTSNEPAAMANATEPEAAAAEPEAAATEPEVAANATEPEEAATGTTEAANVSTEVAQDGDIVDEAPPEIAANVSTDFAQDGEVVDEEAPMVDNDGHDEGMSSFEEPEQETREAIEQRIRKQLMEEMRMETTTVAARQETEEEMRQRIKDELMREIVQSKGQ
ncbi:unnamed protein product [Prorocentrum cordatum]|uniref:Thiol oxidase n=1 Tax=Prorocentrum cordatum TaxID=2364126 RepID=A0ABN9RM91_9DINO|nr:unnamed protein product [Polarella glacialis]